MMGIAPNSSGGPGFGLLDMNPIGVAVQRNRVGISYSLASEVSNIRVYGSFWGGSKSPQTTPHGSDPQRLPTVLREHSANK